MNSDLFSLLKLYNSLPEWEEVNLTSFDQQNGAGDQPIHVAAMRGKVDELELLISSGASVDAKGEQGYTPLMYAIESGLLPAVEFLLSSGANREALNEFEMNAIDLAAALDETELVLVLTSWKKGQC